MTGPCVLDASAALSLLVPSQTTAVAKAFFLDSGHEWCAPQLLHFEVRDAIHRLERRGTLPVGSVDGRLVLLESEIRFDGSADAAFLANVFARARAASLSVYDANYLETAVREQAAIASRDAALLSASRDAGVETFDLR